MSFVTGSFPTTLDNTTLNDSLIGFPVDTEAHVASSLAKLNLMLGSGYDYTTIELKQLLDQFTTYFGANAEAFTVTSAVYTGAGGSTTRHYRAIPRYTLLPAPGNGLASAGYLNSEPGGARTGDKAESRAFLAGTNVKTERTTRYGKPTVKVDVASTAATLDATHYVTITAPANAGSPIDTGVVFDIVACDNSGVPLYWVALGVAISGTAVDDGSHNPATPVGAYQNPYHLPTYIEVTKGATLGRLDLPLVTLYIDG